ncbi:ParB/RepB/Spo0J family partition protein [uncultured Deinococcus sp.]|uniref:ParB/RepB/Spo0J family partition protein n=1 Tax=uncultured Deinococcus sp. TaxID=158789 RepID=UPI002583351B|nr:ParB/RepB/Spo0J family partition protein [uncultured Deinococcus sp.]
MTDVSRDKLEAHGADVEKISPDLIEPNPENPRLIFNQTELDRLLDSISKTGIQVPITVYPSTRNPGKFTILDGERRWRCAKRLNLETVPALIRSAPTPLQNLLIMFNIHNVRENWALLPMAYKLQRIKELAKEETVDGKELTNSDLATITGVRAVQVGRALELLDLPPEDLERLHEELEKPRHEQGVTEDFYIEAMRAAKTVQRHKPEVAALFSRNDIVHSLLEKYDKKIITNIVDIRSVSKLARADKTSDADTDSVNQSLVDLFSNVQTTIKQAYDSSAALSYERRTIIKKITDLSKDLRLLNHSRDQSIFEALEELIQSIDIYKRRAR